MNILVGVSGGVDSAVVLHKLKSEGHNIIGAMMKIYDGNTLTIGNSCYGTNKKKEIEDAIKNCEHVNCEFHLIDLSKEYDSFVFKEFKSQYLNGLTPNPCVECNKKIKFGLLPQKARKMGVKFEKFATGHYAKNEFNENSGRWELKKGINHKKDQTYFLYRLSQAELSEILFPVGNMEKEDVRKYALENNIPVAQKTDSQDFYKGDFSDLFDTDGEKGEITDRYGNVLGYHNGIFNYTIGQRKGLKIAYSEPLYVIDIDNQTNRVVVGVKNDTYQKGLIAKQLNWIALENPNKPFEATAKIRSASNPVDVIVYPNDDEIKVEFKDKISAIAPAQSVVLYQDDIVLGGGIIQKSF
ncbi:MAG: tRNA 2-thiouridine(34) synthase MnmA [Candidatus Gastranaerophilales bacterium]|nr:tRNA 2-thiouridine(34) synthase MnmA [Candidatus Gastranaerophilales bacterium]